MAVMSKLCSWVLVGIRYGDLAKSENWLDFRLSLFGQMVLRLYST